MLILTGKASENFTARERCVHKQADNSFRDGFAYESRSNVKKRGGAAGVSYQPITVMKVMAGKMKRVCSCHRITYR